ncbi:RloB family protein [Lachnospiraceae bacterium 56-18]
MDAISILYRFHHNTKLQTALSKRVRSTIGTNPYYPDEGDMIWCVFDRDENSDGSLQKAKQTAMREGYRLAYSNPSFELWFLLHFVNQKQKLQIVNR